MTTPRRRTQSRRAWRRAAPRTRTTPTYCLESPSARAGQAADAQTAFSAVKNPTLADVARLWKMKLDTPATAPEPAPAARRRLIPAARSSRSQRKSPGSFLSGLFFQTRPALNGALSDLAGYREAVFQSRPISANLGSLIASNAFTAAAMLPCRLDAMPSSMLVASASGTRPRLNAFCNAADACA